MTHTLHRLGNQKNLSEDFVVFAMSAKGLNEIGSAGPLREFLKIALKYDPINLGDMKTGNTFQKSDDEIFENILDVSIVHAVYTDEETVAKLLAEVKSADLGVSVVVSGLFERVKELGSTVNVHQHTMECSAGIWGKVDRLPPAEILQLTTMCGHGMVAANLVNDYVRRIKRGKISPEEAAQKIAEPCVCGVFNTKRAAKLLKLMAENDERTKMELGQTVL